ncbi:MAG: hypothetical protein KC448_06190 [Yoonia sp.]|nr:hypothetical protein [Yoonia sp.]
MRIALSCLVLLTGCTNEANDVGNPLLRPFNGIATLAQNLMSDDRRGPVEVLVKSNHPALIDQINAGTGPILIQAMDTARIPDSDRSARIIQLQSDLGLYAANPGALVTALMVYGNQ